LFVIVLIKIKKIEKENRNYTRQKTMDNILKRILVIFFIVLVFHLLSIMSGILQPLFFALLMSLMFQPLVSFLRSKKIPNFIILPFISVFSLFVIVILGNVVFQIGSEIAGEGEFLLMRLEYRLNNLLIWINSITNLRLDSTVLIKELQKYATPEWLSNVASGIFVGIGSVSGAFIIFAIYYVILLAGMSNYSRYLKFVAGGEDDGLVNHFVKVQKSVVSYIFIKTLINIAAAAIVYGICLLFEVKFPFFWGFLAFIMHFIPNVGSITTTLLPGLMAFIQFDSLRKVIILVVVLGTVQFLIGNLIEPKILGNRLRLNTLTVIFGLVFWGYIWGIAGMMLSVPLLVMIKLIFERIPTLEFIARMMSPTPKINKTAAN